MRRTLTRSAAISSVALAAVVVLAGPAEARRNVGGTLPAGATCVDPGVVVLPAQADAAVPCVCYALDGQRFRFLGRAEGCPPGFPEVKIDRRNVGG
jgi:hypothetical protein